MSDIDFSKIYSFSKLGLFKTCPQQYYFNYLDPEVAPRKKEFMKPRDYKTRGSAVHDAITLFYHLPPKKRTFEKLKECLKKSWFAEKDPHKSMPLGKIGGFRDINHERETYKESLIFLKNFFEMVDKEPNFFFLPTENIKNSFCDYQEMITPIEENISISGKFDRVDKIDNDSLRVIDFKTSRNNNSDYFQLEFYKLLAELNFKKRVSTVSFYYLRNKKIKDFNVKKVEKKEIKDKVLKKVNKIRNTKEFNPNPSRLCNHCDFKEICPVFKKS